MGIDGLLAILKPLIKKQHISSFRNQTLAIDALPWIYKAVYGANIQLGQQILDRNQNAFLYYINEMIDMLEFYNIKMVFVFDGRSLGAKGKTIQKRKKAKEDSKKKAEQLFENNEQEKAKKTRARYITIDQQKLLSTMSLLRERKIEFVVAPYEADSQMSKLFLLQKIDAAITEDSDLIVYGVDVILKLKESGQCDFLSVKVDSEELQKVQCPFAKKFLSFSKQKRAETAVLAGCDYVGSVKGIGIKKAIKLVEENDTLAKIVQKIMQDPKLQNKVPENYLQLAINAKTIFLLALTYNPESKKLQYLNQSEIEDFSIQVRAKLLDQKLGQKVGRQYEFSLAHYQGRISCKTSLERQFKQVNLKELYSFNRENVIREKNQGQTKNTLLQVKQEIVDQATSICWQGESMSEGLAFLLQKELVEKFFSSKDEHKDREIELSEKNLQLYD